MKPLLLSILPRPPHPTRDGLAIRNYFLLRALAGEFRVRAAVLRAPHLPPGEYPEGVEAQEIAQASRLLRRPLAASMSLVSRSPYSELLYRSRALDNAVTRLASEGPAWIVAHSYHVGPYAVGSGYRSWIDFHNVDSQIWQRVGQSAAALPARWFAARQARRVRALEVRLVASADAVSCVSDLDAGALARLPMARSRPFVVPNGVDLDRYRLREPPPGKTVLFVGDLSWPPNADAVRWFRREIWPLIRRDHADARAEILGREPPKDLRALASPDFALLGEITDTRPHWRRASVSVVPLTAGGGTRLKILEAAACGVPVVSTRIGAEGLSLAPGRDFILADDAAGFARAVSDLLGDSSRRKTIASAARARVEGLYDWPSIGAGFVQELLRRCA